MSTLRPLGVGSQILTHGDKMDGFYGEVNGIITADELRSITNVAQGSPLQTGDITWLKFSHNYKTLYISKQPIQHSISWDYLHERDLVFGKMIEIDGKAYLLRLIQGNNVSPRASGVQAGTNEWDNLMMFLISLGLYNEVDFGTGATNGRTTICMEVGVSLESRVTRGGSSIGGVSDYSSNNTVYVLGWRPVLELLYER